MSEELSGDAPEIGGEEVSGEPSAWEAWEKAGIDPSGMNPYEVRQYVDWVSELTNPDSHEAALEQALRRWGHLGDDESLQELINYRDEIRSQRDDPFARLLGGEEQQPGYEDYEQQQYQQQYQEQNLIDPYELRDIWRQDMQQQLAQEREQMQQQLQTERLVQDLENQLDQVASSQELDENERAFLWEAATTKLVNRQVDLDAVPSLMQDTWNQIDSLYQKRVARSAQSAQAGPTTTASPGATPGDVPPGRGIQSALARTAERLGIPQE